MIPLISVISPVHNVELFIDKCIKNLWTDTYQRLQVILVDDGSTDLSGEYATDMPQKMSAFLLFTRKTKEYLERGCGLGKCW